MMAWFKRHPDKHTGLIFHSVRGSQYLSIRYSERLAEAGIQPSVGSKGLLRQRTGRDHQRAVQGRVNSPPESLEEQGIRGAGHPAMGVLVQPHPTAQADWGEHLRQKLRQTTGGISPVRPPHRPQLKSTSLHETRGGSPVEFERRNSVRLALSRKSWSIQSELLQITRPFGSFN